MINVCTNCLRLNPLGKKKCGHCQGACQAMESQEYGRFMLTNHGQREQAEREKEIEASEDILKEYPDLRVFEDCRSLRNQFDFVIARP